MYFPLFCIWCNQERNTTALQLLGKITIKATSRLPLHTCITNFCRSIKKRNDQIINFQIRGWVHHNLRTRVLNCLSLKSWILEIQKLKVSLHRRVSPRSKLSNLVQGLNGFLLTDTDSIIVRLGRKRRTFLGENKSQK